MKKSELRQLIREELLKENRKRIKVRELDKRDDLVFVSDSQDVEAIEELYPETKEYDFDSYFVKVAGSDYEEIYGMEGIVPDLNKTATKIK